MQPNSDPLAVELAHWIEALKYDDLPPAVIHHVRRCLIDYLGVTIRGSGSRVARLLQDHLSATEGAGPATVVGSTLKFSPANAALANGCAAAALELDDGHARTAIHLGATCLPAILAMAEASGVSDRNVMLATAAAYEIAARVALAMPRAAARGFTLTPLVGVVGAAIGTAKVVGSGSATITHALGMAGSNAGGLFDYHGGWLDTWPLNVGRAGRDGLLCVTLAQAGLAGPADILDGPLGFAATFADGEFDTAGVLAGLGRDWLMLETYVKPYPCCRRLHSPIDAALELRARGLDLDAVDRITVETTAQTARLDRKTFDGVASAQMSVPYGVAVALAVGAPGLEHFEDATRRDPRILRLLDKILVRASDDPVIAGSRSAARVSVCTGAAATSATIAEPLGNPARPLDDAVLAERFLYLAEPVIGLRSALRLNELIWGLGEGADVVSLSPMLQEIAACSHQGRAGEGALHEEQPAVNEGGRDRRSGASSVLWGC